MDCCKKAMLLVVASVAIFCYFLYGPFAYTLSEMAIHFVDNANEPCRYFCESYINSNAEQQLCCTQDYQPSCVPYSHCQDNKRQLREELVRWNRTGLLVTAIGGAIIGVVLCCVLHIALMHHNYHYEQCCLRILRWRPFQRRRNNFAPEVQIDINSLLGSDMYESHVSSFTGSDTTCSICHEEMPTKNHHRLRCGHCFHKECIGEWFSRRSADQRVCPNCRVLHQPTLL